VLTATEEFGAEPLSRELRALIVEAGAPAGPAAPGQTGLLSDKQLEVVRRMAGGLSDKQIAKEMGLKPGTVARHGYDARQKLAEHGYTRVSSRMGLVNWAREQGLLEEPGSTRATTEGAAP
jgi:DNA-binding CsgD family transcriptional regulator